MAVMISDDHLGHMVPRGSGGTLWGPAPQPMASFPILQPNQANLSLNIKGPTAMIWARPLTFPPIITVRGTKNLLGSFLIYGETEGSSEWARFSLWAVAPGLGWAIIGLTWAGDLISVMSPLSEPWFAHL